MIDNIQIKNFGPIVDFKYKFKKTDKLNPIPLVLLGKNGTGKTLLLEKIVDSYLTIKKELYPQSIPEISKENGLYQVISPEYINEFSNFYSISISHVYNKPLTFNEFSSKIIYNDFAFLKEIGWDQNACDQIPKQISQNKKLINTQDTTVNDFRKEIFVYFPIMRGYFPLINNKVNENWETSEKFTGQATDNSIIHNLYNNIDSYIKDIILDKYAGLERQRSQTIFNSITSIMKNIKNINDGHFYVYERKTRKIGFQWEDKGISHSSLLNQLSSGEMIIFSLATNILKHADLYQSTFDGSLNSICGTVLIDEVDMNLHIELQHDLLPSLIKLFPNIQFIMSTHSPFSVVGFMDAYKENIDFLMMPNGTKIDDINKFDEMNEAYKIFNEETNKILTQNEDLKIRIEKLNAQTNKVIVLTEGESDKLLLIKAKEKLNPNIDIQIESIDANNENGRGNSKLKNLILNLHDNPLINNSLVIGMFDRDTPIRLKTINGEKDLLSEPYIKVDNNLYSFAIPIPHNRKEDNQISIEHYFTNKEIKSLDGDKRLFLMNEFYESGTHKVSSKKYFSKTKIQDSNSIKIIELETNKGVVSTEDEKKSFSISKKRFAQNIVNSKEGFSDFDFSQFEKIFEQINNIIEANKL